MCDHIIIFFANFFLMSDFTKKLTSIYFSLGLFDSLSTSDPDPSLQWNTSDELDCPSDNSFDRKVSPPFLDILTESRTRSGSDPSISLDGNNKKKLSEHRKSSQEATPSSPKSG